MPRAVQASQLLERGAGVTSNGAVAWVAFEDGAASYVHGALVTGAYFEVLGITPVLGRALTTTDDVPGAENVIVISHGLWKRRYGGSRDAIGRRMILGGTAFTIVGVMPPGLDYPSGVEVWRTVGSVPTGGVFGDAAHYEVDLIARLRPGASIDQAASELATIAERLESTAPADHPRGLVPVVRSFEAVIVGDVRTAMLALFGAVALVPMSSWPCRRSSRFSAEAPVQSLAAEESRYQVGLPVSVEVARGAVRMFAATGLFSRGEPTGTSRSA